jgi:carboxylesterase
VEIGRGSRRCLLGHDEHQRLQIEQWEQSSLFHVSVSTPTEDRVQCFMESKPARPHRKSAVPDHSIRIAGGRTGVLLIHGLGGTPAEMLYVAQGLARAGHTVHVPLLAGHCQSVSDLKATCWEDWYGSVEQEHLRLRAACDTVVVGGLSMGAILGIHHAAKHPADVAALALYAPCIWLDGWAMPWYSQLSGLFLSKRFADRFSFVERHPWGVKDPRTREIVKQAMNSGDASQAGVAALPGGQLVELRRLVRTVKRELPTVAQPALILHPRDDDHASLRNLEFLQSHLGGRTEAVVLDDSYHIITIDKQRQLVVNRTAQFIDLLSRVPAMSHELDALSSDTFGDVSWTLPARGSRHRRRDDHRRPSGTQPSPRQRHVVVAKGAASDPGPPQ